MHLAGNRPGETVVHKSNVPVGEKGSNEAAHGDQDLMTTFENFKKCCKIFVLANFWFSSLGACFIFKSLYVSNSKHEKFRLGKVVGVSGVTRIRRPSEFGPEEGKVAAPRARPLWILRGPRPRASRSGTTARPVRRLHIAGAPAAGVAEHQAPTPRSARAAPPPPQVDLATGPGARNRASGTRGGCVDGSCP